MSFFGGRAGPSSSSSGAIAGGDQNARKLEVMNQVRSELASAHLQELVNVRLATFKFLYLTEALAFIISSIICLIRAAPATENDRRVLQYLQTVDVQRLDIQRQDMFEYMLWCVCFACGKSSPR